MVVCVHKVQLLDKWGLRVSKGKSVRMYVRMYVCKSVSLWWCFEKVLKCLWCKLRNIQYKTYHINTDAARTPRLFPNGVTAVVEGRQVHLSCESDGRPTPNVTISNNDNNTVIKTDSSPVNHTFIARCEDMATYTCIAWNKFSRHLTTSLSLTLEVGCK